MNTSESNDYLADIRQKVSEVRKLLDKQEKKTSENEQYKLKYTAINTLKEVESELSNIVIGTKEWKENEDIMLAIVHLNLGILHADTDDLKAGEEQFMKCVEMLKDRELEPEAILPTISALNQLGIIWSQWSQLAKAKLFLTRAEQLYNDFMNEANERRAPVDMSVFFGIEDSTEGPCPEQVIEKVHTLTLYYLAQVYGALREHHKSAVYCHMTLRRQLRDNDNQKDFDYVEWALNAATLSQYFMENERFTEARHHLAAASYILLKFENLLKQKSSETNEEKLNADWENYRHRSADVARCWAKYGILLMSLSKERLFKKLEADDTSECTESKDSRVTTPKDCKGTNSEDLKFTTIEGEIESIANQVTDKYLLDFSDARPVFINALRWLEQAKTYYTLNNHASDYVQIVQDMSQAYKHLLFFEESEDRQAIMHKRRIDILESVIKELNPQYYKEACRQIWIELGETYSDIMDIKLDRLRSSNEKPTARALMKINHLAKCSIQNFQSFLNSLETQTNGTGLVKFPDDISRVALSAYFHLGRLYHKMITPSKVAQLDNLQNSINAYKFVVDYCERDPKAAELIQMELNLCRELLALLPLKVDRLKQEMMDQGVQQE